MLVHGENQVAGRTVAKSRVAESSWDPELLIFEEVSQNSCVFKPEACFFEEVLCCVFLYKMRLQSMIFTLRTDGLRCVGFVGFVLGGSSDHGRIMNEGIFRSILELAFFEEVLQNSYIFISWPPVAVTFLVLCAVFGGVLVTYIVAKAVFGDIRSVWRTVGVSGAVFSSLV